MAPLEPKNTRMENREEWARQIVVEEADYQSRLLEGFDRGDQEMKRIENNILNNRRLYLEQVGMRPEEVVLHNAV